MSLRYLLLFGFLGFIVAFAGLLAMGQTVWWLTPLHWLGRFPLFHVAAHFSMFAGVVYLYGPPERSIVRLWLVVLSGSVLLELVQFVAGGFVLTRSLLLDSLFDIGVDVAGAATAWLSLAAYRNRKRRWHPAAEC